MPFRFKIAAIAASAAIGLSSELQAGSLGHAEMTTSKLPVERVAVFGTDDRTNVPARFETVALKVGLLFNNQSRTVCSAFCVAENVIATAAHCLHKAHAGSAMRHADYVFARNYDRSRDLVRIDGATTGSASQNILAGDFRMRVKPPIDAAHDWALVKLQRDACPGGGLTVKALSSDELIEQAKDSKIFQVSYHRDWAQWRAAYSKPCQIGRDFDRAPWSSISPDFMEPEHITLHTCDTGGASSGSPVLLETADGPVVIAINVGTYVQSKVTSQRGQVARQRSDTIANTAVSATAFAHLIEPLRSQSIITNGGQMRELQERLKSWNLYTGRIDGIFGPSMKAAIEAHERALQKPVTGLATLDLLTTLATAPDRSGAVAPSSSTDAPRR